MERRPRFRRSTPIQEGDEDFGSRQRFGVGFIEQFCGVTCGNLGIDVDKFLNRESSGRGETERLTRGPISLRRRPLAIRLPFAGESVR